MPRIMVEHNDRTFTVTFDEEGKAIRISERKIHQIADWHDGTFYESSYWHHNSHRPGGPDSIVQQVIGKARAKKAQRWLKEKANA